MSQELDVFSFANDTTSCFLVLRSKLNFSYILHFSFQCCNMFAYIFFE